MNFVTPFRRATLDLAALVPTLPARLPRLREQPAARQLHAAMPSIEAELPRPARPVLVARWERDTEPTVQVGGETFQAGLLRLRWQLVDPEATGAG